MKLFLDRVDQASIAILADKKRIIEVHTALDKESNLSSVYVGKVYKIKKSINSAFLKINGNEDVYMPLSDKSSYFYVKNTNDKENLCQGDEILVEIIKYGDKEKLNTVSPSISLYSDNFILLTDKKGIYISKKISNPDIYSMVKTVMKNSKQKNNFGILARTSADKIEIVDLERELSALIQKFQKIIYQSTHFKTNAEVLKVNSLEKIINELKRQYSFNIISKDEKYFKDISNVQIINKKNYDYFLLEYGIKDKLKKLFFKKILLKSGANIVIEKTEAMYVIDVNSHKSSMSKNNKKAILKNNIEAAIEIIYQIKARNLAGIILVDFINMNDETLEKQLINTIENHSIKEGLSLIVHDITKLSLMEITRKKTSYSVYENETLKKYLGFS